MAAGSLDPLGPVEFRRRAGGFIFVGTVEALEEGRIELRDLGQHRSCITAADAEPLRDVEFEGREFLQP
jgi:hypothetical protein